MTEKLKGLKPLDYHVDFTNLCEPIVVDNPTEQEEWFKKKLIETLENISKPKKTGYLMMTPDDDKIEKVKSFENDEISFKCELKDDFGFKRRGKHD